MVGAVGTGRALYCTALALVLVLPQAAHSQVPACTGRGQDCGAVEPGRDAVRTLQYWKAALALPVEQRIGPAPAAMLDYLTQDNIKNSIPNRPRPATLAREFMRDVQQAFAELPAAVKRRLTGKLAGVHFVEDLGGTGFTDEIVDPDSRAVAGFVILDAAVLSAQTANTWATWKESTPFKPQPGFDLAAEIEGKSENNRKNAIQYILLHELGHVLSIGEKIHPSWSIEAKDAPTTSGLDYFSLSWTVARNENRYASVFDRDFPQRSDVRYYFGAKLSGEQMADVYSQLEATNFPTLYAATHPADDWAEALVTYVHTVMMNKPFGIRIFHEGKLVKHYQSCWTEKRCEDKRRIVEQFLKGK
jgi:hypothetical protein